MQAGFIGFGLLLNAGFILKFAAAGKTIYPDILIMIYGLAILLSGFFCTAPIHESIPYSLSEARLHSIFASVAGLSFSLAVLWYLGLSAQAGQRWFHLVFLVLTVGSSLLFGLAENGAIPVGKGVVQRVLYTISWLMEANAGDHNDQSGGKMHQGERWLRRLGRRRGAAGAPHRAWSHCALLPLWHGLR